MFHTDGGGSGKGAACRVFDVDTKTTATASSSLSMDTEPTPSIDSEKKRYSISEEAKRIREKANHLIVRIPAQQLRKIAATPGIGSIQSETQHFVGISSLHGPVRIYRSHGTSRLFWILAMFFCSIFMFYQIKKLVQEASKQQVVSQISFRLPDEGLVYPTLTICSFNFISNRYLEFMKRNYSLSDELLRYMLMSSVELQLIPETRIANLEKIEDDYQEFVKANPWFTLHDLFADAAPECTATLWKCFYASEEFDCCDYVTPIMTDLGNCFQIDVDVYAKGKNITPQAGVNNGLQIYAAYRDEDMINQTDYEFMSNIETGFRFYIHPNNVVPHTNLEGVIVSPRKKAFTSVSPNHYVIYPTNDRCVQDWSDDVPKNFTEKYAYSSSICQAYCVATYLNEKCGCTPFLYSLNGTFRTCSLFENYSCLNNSFMINPYSNDTDNTIDIMNQILPDCSHCRMECDRWDYEVYTSYSDGFSRAVNSYLLKAERARLQASHSFLSQAAISRALNKRYAGIAVFFREVSYTEYEQVTKTSLSETLSDIGGNMGLFLGMSVLTVIEVVIYLFKVTWLFLSSRRRQYMFNKMSKQKERQKRIEQTLEEIAQSQPDSSIDSSAATSMANRLRRLAGSLKRKTAAVWHPDAAAAADNAAGYYLDNIVVERTMGMGKAAEPGQIVELELDLDQAEPQLSKVTRSQTVVGRHGYPRPKPPADRTQSAANGNDNLGFMEDTSNPNINAHSRPRSKSQFAAGERR